MALTLVFGIFFVIYFKPIADWLDKKVTEFFYKEPRGGWRETVIKASEFYVGTWYMIYLTGVFLVFASVMATLYFWWALPIPFILFGAGFMFIGLEMRKRTKKAASKKEGG